MICSLQKQHSSLRSDSTPNIVFSNNMWGQSIEMNILHSELILQQWVGLNSAKSKLVCILFIVGQKKKCRVFSYPTRSLSWFPRFSSFISFSETTISCGGDIGCIYNYLCNQCLLPLMLWVRISIRARCTALCDKVCQWLASGRWFSPGPVFEDYISFLQSIGIKQTNKTNLFDGV
jgi:hypothetical protein